MKKTLLIFYLVLYVVLMPFLSQPCFADFIAKKKIAIVQTYEEAPSRELNQLSSRIEKYLSTASDVVIIPETDVAAYFGNNDQKNSNMTKGDRLFLMSEDLYYSATPEKSYNMIKSSIVELKKNPGVSGNLVKAYLLKALVEWYINRPADAQLSLLSAISYNLSQQELSDFYYDPKMRHFYNKAYQEFIKSHEIINLNVRCHGQKKSPIYVNGMLRGYSPQITIKVPSEQIQLIRAGNNPEAPLVTVSNQRKVQVTAKQNLFDENKMNPVGFKNDTSANLIEKSFGLGSFLGADYIVLLKKQQESNDLQQVQVSVVNVRKYSIAATKTIDVHDLSKSYKSVANLTGDFIMSLNSKNVKGLEQNFAAAAPPAEPVVTKTKKNSKSFFKGAGGKILIGALVVGAASALALGMSSSGSGSGAGGISSASVSGPLPTVPSD